MFPFPTACKPILGERTPLDNIVDQGSREGVKIEESGSGSPDNRYGTNLIREVWFAGGRQNSESRPGGARAARSSF